MKPQVKQVILCKPEHVEKAIQSAEKNGGVLTRLPDGTWRGASDELQRYTTDIVALLVRENRAVYTRFKERSQAATEVRIGLENVYANYQIQ